MARPPSLQFGKDLCRVAEGEVMQHDNVFLLVEDRVPVSRTISGAASSCCSCNPTCECIQCVPDCRTGKS